jgi:glycosyltransferase involved in cell wall biosynthesis
MRRDEPTMERRPLHLFIPHSSDVLTDHLPHGDGLIATEFVRQLAERGHTIDAVTQRLALLEPLPVNVRVHVIPPHGNNVAAIRLGYMKRLRTIFQATQREKPLDLIHQMNPVFAGLSLALTGTRTPLILGTFVGRWGTSAAKTASLKQSMSGRMKAAARDLVARTQQSQAARLLLTTPAALDRIPAMKAMAPRIRWVGHGVDTDIFSPAENAWSPELSDAEQRQPRILFFANISQRKGIFPLLHAFVRVHAAMPEARLTVAGDGPDLPAMRECAEQLGIAASVDFLGAQPHANAPDLYRSHALYCLPSLGEPYATTVLEAMSCGRPLVVTDTGGLPYMVSKEGGHRVAQDNPKALADALLDLLRNPERRAAMGRHNREDVLAKHTWSATIDALETVYYDLLAERATQAKEVRR